MTREVIPAEFCCCGFQLCECDNLTGSADGCSDCEIELGELSLMIDVSSTPIEDMPVGTLEEANLGCSCDGIDGSFTFGGEQGPLGSAFCSFGDSESAEAISNTGENNDVACNWSSAGVAISCDPATNTFYSSNGKRWVLEINVNFNEADLGENCPYTTGALSGMYAPCCNNGLAGGGDPGDCGAIVISLSGPTGAITPDDGPNCINHCPPTGAVWTLQLPDEIPEDSPGCFNVLGEVVASTDWSAL